jgi:hypothetical protein
VTASEQAVKVWCVEDTKQEQWLVARLEGQWQRSRIGMVCRLNREGVAVGCML